MYSVIHVRHPHVEWFRLTHDHYLVKPLFISTQIPYFFSVVRKEYRSIISTAGPNSVFTFIASHMTARLVPATFTMHYQSRRTYKAENIQSILQSGYFRALYVSSLHGLSNIIVSIPTLLVSSIRSTIVMH